MSFFGQREPGVLTASDMRTMAVVHCCIGVPGFQDELLAEFEWQLDRTEALMGDGLDFETAWAQARQERKVA